jgi:hypothetical protein
MNLKSTLRLPESSSLVLSYVPTEVRSKIEVDGCVAATTRRHDLSPLWSVRRTDVYRTDVPFGLPVSTLRRAS